MTSKTRSLSEAKIRFSLVMIIPALVLSIQASPSVGQFPHEAITQDPAEMVEARQQYDEAIEQAIKPYREELEKELALAKKNGALNSVLALEAELKHLASDERTKLTSFKPEKRALLNAKLRFKRKIETTLVDYQKKLDTIVKELVRTERTQEAQVVQEILDAANEQTRPTVVPKRASRPAQPVFRLTMEIGADGKGRLLSEKCMTTTPPASNFPGVPFSLPSFPKAQAYRGENGMGRMIFDLGNMDSKETWEANLLNQGKWWGFNAVKLDFAGKMIVPEPNRDFRRLYFAKSGIHLPCRFSFESVAASKNAIRKITIFLTKGNREADIHALGDFTSWCEATYTVKENDKTITKKDLFPRSSDFDKSFQIPVDMLGDSTVVKFSAEIIDDYSGITMVDLAAKFSVTSGIEVDERDETVNVKKVSAGSVAFRAGLREGDLIVRFNGRKRSAEQIQKVLDNVRFGDLVTIAVTRDGEEKLLRFHAE